MTRLLFATALLGTSAALAAPVPVVPPDLTKDRNGYPLPKGATARLGSLDFRGPLTYVASFSADGKTLHATSGWAVLSWDANTGRPLPTKSFVPAGEYKDAGASILVGDRLFGLAWKPRVPGERGGPFGAVVALDRDTGAEVGRIPLAGHGAFGGYYSPAQRPPAVSVGADGRYAAVLSDANKRVEVYDVFTGKQLHTQPADPYLGGSLVAPDNKTLYICDAKGPVRRCELVSGKALPDLAGTGPRTLVLAVSPDGKLAATWTRGEAAAKDAGGAPRAPAAPGLTILDAAANRVLRTLELDVAPGEFAFAGPAAVVIVGLRSKPPAAPVPTLSRWDVTTGKKEWEVVDPPGTAQLNISPDGRRGVTLASNHILHPFDATTGKPLGTAVAHEAAVAWVGWSADGTTVHTADGRAVMSWTRKGERTASASPPELRAGQLPRFVSGQPLIWPVPSADGKTRELVGWDADKRGVGWRMKVEEKVERVLTHDGRRAVGVRWDEAAREWAATVYDGPGGRVLHRRTFKTGDPQAGPYWWPGLALSADGARLFVAAADVQAIDLASGKQERFAAVGPAPLPDPLFAVSADGARVLLGSRDRPGAGNPARDPVRSGVYEPKTGKQLAAHELPPVPQPGVALDPGGGRYAVWSDRGPLLVCDAEPGRRPRDLTVAGQRPTCAAFSPDGKTLAVGYADGTALLWDPSAK